MKLNEIKLLEMPEDFLTDPDQILDWLAKHNIKPVRDHGNYSMVRPNRDGTVDILPSASAYGSQAVLHFTQNTLLLGKDHLPVQLSEIGKLDIILDNMPIKNLKGMPKQMYGNLRLSNCRHFTSFAGAPTELGSLKINGGGPLSLRGINDHIKKFTDWGNLKVSIIDTEIIAGGIGLLLIEGFDAFYFNGIGQRAGQAMSIICDYKGRPDDIFECQSELIDAGLEEFAQL